MAVTPLDDFSPPCSDGSIPLSALSDFHLENNPDHEFAILIGKSENGDSSSTSVKYRHLGLAVHRVAHLVNPGAMLPQGTKVGIIVSTDSITNIALVLGTMRAGLVPFPISPRASVAGICHLLLHTGTHHAIVGGGSAIAHLVDKVKVSADKEQHCLFTIPLPSFEELFLELSQPYLEHIHKEFFGIESVAGTSIVAILHSSGSTGLPRAVPYSQAGLLSNFVNQPPCWEMGGPGARVGLMALPTFHVMGFMTQCFFPQFSGYTSVLFAPAPSPIIPSPDVTLQSIISSRCEFLLTVPAFLEAWSQDVQATSVLRDLKGVVYAGGPLTPWIGNLLIKHGVPMRAAYGSTELGAPVVFNLVQRAPEDWIYVEFPDYTKLELIPQNDEDGTFELVMLSTPRHEPFVINYHANGQSGYATKDLVLPHPIKHGLLKFVGRVDDQIVLANGEKTNPVPMEAEIIKCPLVRAAVVFGREHNQVGLLVELEDSKTESTTHMDFDSVAEHLWPFIEKANYDASTHSRIIREAIIFSDSKTPLPRTPKGNVARAASLELYAKEISAMYKQLENYQTPSFGASVSWQDRHVVEAWLSICAERVLHHEIDASSDLFQQGLDSLTATLLLGSIKGAMLSDPSFEVRHASEKVTQRTIFGQPTIRQLTNYLMGLIATELGLERDWTGESSTEASSQAMDAMVEKYTQALHTPSHDRTRFDSLPLENIVLTGTTGALGSHLLALILSNDQVKRVWALNRAPKEGAMSTMQRQRAAFSEKRLDMELLGHPKLTLLECDLLDCRLGLSQAQYEEIQEAATTVIHNAWQVDFNLSLQSFEPSICGTRHLLDLASKHGPRFVFTSSISAVGLGSPGRVCTEEHMVDSNVAAGFGYGESKYVAEKLLKVARSIGIQTCVVRLGQLTGDTTSGAWSKTDWVPSLVASSVAIGHLPDAVGTISWLPLDAAAKTMLDICRSSELEFPSVVHVVHPRPLQWSSMMRAFSQVTETKTGKRLQLLPFDEWNQMVVQAASSSDSVSRRQRYPSTNIQATFDKLSNADTLTRDLCGMISKEVEALGAPRLQTSVCESLSSSLSSLHTLGYDDAARWMSYWESKGLFFEE